MVELSTPGYIVAEQLRYIAAEEVAASFLGFFSHLRAGVAMGLYGRPVEGLLARVHEAGLTVIMKELARGDARLPWDMQVEGDSDAAKDWLTVAHKANMVRYAHQALSRILRGRLARITRFLLGESTRFAALAPWLARLGANDESAAQERAANARAISACQGELHIIAMAAASWACAAGASAISPKHALRRLRRAWSALRLAVRFHYEVTSSVCHQLASAAIEHRDLSERIMHAIGRQRRQAASG